MSDHKARFGTLRLECRALPSRATVAASSICGAALLDSVWCVPAAAQCDAYVAQNASNSTWVINTMTDMSGRRDPGAVFRPLA